MGSEFSQIEWDDQLADDCRQLIRLAVREDLDRHYDLTTVAIVPNNKQGRAAITTRQDGIICGLKAGALVLDEMEISADFIAKAEDGQAVSVGTTVAELSGCARDLLTAERTLLNLIGRLSGIATLTQRFVNQIAGTGCCIYDTRKTTPGMRRLEKYAVRCGGGTNHRTGLFDAVLIKDNHLALMADVTDDANSVSAAVRIARAQIRELFPTRENQVPIEVEVDSLDQLQQVLPDVPDIVLLDNMSCDELRRAVEMRDTSGVATQLEASGGITFDTVRSFAKTGVERISIGALTHSAISLDLGLDWKGLD